MPNWCNNQIEIQGEKEQLDAFEKFLTDNNGKNWFDFFSPCPEELLKVESPNRSEKSTQALVEKYGHSDWYSWSLENWGCKWNCDVGDWSRNGDDSISFWFDSPWGPPVILYEKIENDHDLIVNAGYHEEGMAFVGRYSEGFDESYNYSDLESLDEIPEDIVDEWNLREMLEERAEWEEENEDE